MFSKVSKYLTQQLEEENIVPSDKLELYRYGFQQSMILTLNFLTSIIIGIVFGKALESLFLLMVYMPLRSYAGGHHSDTSEKCYVTSSMIMLIWILLLKFQLLSTSCCVIILIIGVIISTLLSPVEDKNKPLDKDEVRIYRKRALIILGIVILAWLLCVFVIHRFEQIIPIAVFTESIMLILGKIKNTKKANDVL